MTDETKTSPFSPAPKLEYFFLLALLVYIGCHGYVNYLKNPNEYSIGYADYVAWSDPLEKLLDGKIIGKDFMASYGPLFYFSQVPFYYLFGANHWALLMNLHIVIPLFSILIAHFYIRIFVKVPLLRIFFIIVCLFHYSTGLYNSPRHLCAELTLGLFLFSLTQPNKRFWFVVAGVMQGISILIGTEYGIAVFVAISATLSIFAITNSKIHAKKLATFFLSGFLISVSPFIFYMMYHSALIEFLKNYYLLITTFTDVDPPGRSSTFPPFPKIYLDNLSESLNHFLSDQPLRFYLPLVFYGISGLIFLIHFSRRQNPANFKFFLLPCFGLMIFYRSLMMPAYHYIAYAFIPAITLGFIFLENLYLRAAHHYKSYNWQTGYNLKSLFNSSLYTTILLFVFTWFFQTIENKFLLTFNSGEKKSSEMVYYEKVGFEISKEAFIQYILINNYIKNLVRPDEYIFTYPWGYYSYFTGRRSAIDFHDAAYAIPTERDTKRASKQLEERKPPLVILNTLNSGDSIGAIRGDTPNQVSWRTEDSPLFAGNGGLIQLYILENYHLHKKFKIASILKRNEKKKYFNQTFNTKYINDEEKIKTILNGAKPTKRNSILAINDRKVRIEYVLKEPQYATHIELKFKINQDSHKKIFTKSFLRIGLIDSSSEKPLGGPNINDFGDLGYIKTKLEGTAVPNKTSLKKISSIIIKLETPKPYLLPKDLHIISLKLKSDKRIILNNQLR